MAKSYWLFDLAKASPEEKLEQRFLILRHLRAKVPLPLLSKGVGAILIDLKNEIKKSLKIHTTEIVTFSFMMKNLQNVKTTTKLW